MGVTLPLTFPEHQTIEVRQTIFLRDLDARAFVSRIPESRAATEHGDGRVAIEYLSTGRAEFAEHGKAH